MNCPELTIPLSSNLTNLKFVEFLSYVENVETKKRAVSADMDVHTLIGESRALEKMWIAVQNDKVELTGDVVADKKRVTVILQKIVCHELNEVFAIRRKDNAAVSYATFSQTAEMEDNSDDPEREYQEKRIADEKRLIARCKEVGVEYHELDTPESLNIKVAEKRKRSLKGIVWEYVEAHGWQKNAVMAAAIHSANPKYALGSINAKISAIRNAEKTDKTPINEVAARVFKDGMSFAEFGNLMANYEITPRRIRQIWKDLKTTTSNTLNIQK